MAGVADEVLSEEYVRQYEERLTARIEARGEDLAQLRAVEAQYGEVRQVLATLPDRVRQEVMVPFGSLAMFRGTVEHTNEIMVSYGDNYFVERSAKQAAELVRRRVAFVRGECDKIEEEKSQLQSTLEHLQTLMRDEEEIVEHESDDGEDDSSYLPEAPQRVSAEQIEAFNRRLEELERLEAAGIEVEPDDEPPAPAASPKSPKDLYEQIVRLQSQAKDDSEPPAAEQEAPAPRKKDQGYRGVGAVMERDPVVQAPPEPKPDVKSEPKRKRVSKFKQKRMEERGDA